MLRSWTSEHFWSDPRSQSIFDYSQSRNNVFCDSGLPHDTRHIRVFQETFLNDCFRSTTVFRIVAEECREKKCVHIWTKFFWRSNCIAVRRESDVWCFQGKVDDHVLSASLPWSSGEVFCFTSFKLNVFGIPWVCTNEGDVSNTFVREVGRTRNQESERVDVGRREQHFRGNVVCVRHQSSSCSAGAKLVNGGLTWLFDLHRHQ